MKWSWKIGRFRGIELRVHATFLILLAWVAVTSFRESGTASGAVIGILFILALFASVVLHEFGHALVGRRFGVPTRDVTLLPIGGVARMEFIPDKPRQEFWIAIAGPAVTLGIIAVLFAALRIAGLSTMPPESVTKGGFQAGGFAAQIMWVNVSLLVFNLLPAFPMDGGRVLRALLAMRMDYVRATEVAARVGRGFAILFGVVGMVYSPMLVLIALFVWLAAASEAAAIQMRSMLGGVTVDRVMVREFHTLAAEDTLDAAQQRLLASFQQDFPVLDRGKLVGVLTRAALLDGLKQRGKDSPVAESMETSFRTAGPRDDADQAVARLGETRSHTAPVVSDGKVMGLLTLDNVGEFVMLLTAQHRPATGNSP